MNSPSERSPQPPNDEHEQRITALEENVKSQQQELLLLRQHIDNGFAQLGKGLLELELRMRTEIHATEQRLADQAFTRAEANLKRQEEHFRWIFGLLVIVLLSNSAAILTMMTLLQNR
jgi:hypothetical protein